MAKYIRCIETVGSIVLFDGLVAMEYLNEMRLSDDAFTRTDVQDAIVAGTIIEISAPGIQSTASFVLIGEWDATTESNYPPEIFGHSYSVSVGGQLTNGVQTETYEIGDRILFNLQGIWEKIGGEAVTGGFTGSIQIASIIPSGGDAGLGYTETRDSSGSVITFESFATEVEVTIKASPSATGGIPSVTFDGSSVTMLDTPSGWVGVITHALTTATVDAVHGAGAIASVDTTSNAFPQILSATIVDTFNVLTGARTEYTHLDQVEVEFTTTSDVAFVQLEASGASRGSNVMVFTSPGAGPHNVTSTVNTGVGNGPIRLRLAVAANSVEGFTYGDWFTTDNQVLYSDVAIGMVKGSVVMNRINPLTSQPYEYLTIGKKATISGNSFSNLTAGDTISVTSGLSGNIGNIPNPPATDFVAWVDAFQVEGVGYDKGTTADKAGGNALIYTMTRGSNGVVSVVSDQLIPYFSKLINVKVDTNQESLISSRSGYYNWIALDADDIHEENLLTGSITLEHAVGAGAWHPDSWDYIHSPGYLEAPEWCEGKFARKLLIRDDYVKGEYSWGAMTAKTISGDNITWIPPATYLLAGFEERTVNYFAATVTWLHDLIYPEKYNWWENGLTPTSGYYAEIYPDVGQGAGYVPNKPFVYNPALLVCNNNSMGAGPANYDYSPDITRDSDPLNTEYSILNDLHGPGGVSGANIVGHGVIGGILDPAPMFHGAIWFNRNSNNSENHGYSTVLISESRSPFNV